MLCSTALAEHLFTTPPPEAAYFLGLDLGQSHDHSALVVVERRSRRRLQSDGVIVTGLAVAHQWRITRAERIPLGVHYRDVQRRAAALVRKLGPACTLIVDASGVGAPVVESLRADLPAARVLGVVITSGSRATRGPGRWNVPRGELVGLLRLMVEKGDLRAALGMSGWDHLREEMRCFVAGGSSSSGPPAPSSARDDLVMALALACWGARRGL